MGKDNLPKSRYDEFGRPIKSGFFSKSYGNISNSNRYRSSNFINNNYEEEREIRKYKEKISQKYDEIDKKFMNNTTINNNNLNQNFINNFNNKSNFKVNFNDAKFMMYIYYMVFGFFVPFFGLFIGLTVLTINPYKNNREKINEYKAINRIAHSLIFYSTIFLSLVIITFIINFY